MRTRKVTVYPNVLHELRYVYLCLIALKQLYFIGFDGQMVLMAAAETKYEKIIKIEIPSSVFQTCPT